MERDTVSVVKNNIETLCPEKEDIVLAVHDGSFHVGMTEPLEIEANAVFTLSGINIRVKRGEILAVVGPVASGSELRMYSILSHSLCIMCPHSCHHQNQL